MSTALIILACLTLGAIIGYIMGWERGVKTGIGHGASCARRKHQHPLAAKYWDSAEDS